MSPKHVLLPILLAVIIANTIADELHPRTWKLAVEVSSFHSNSEPNQDIWKLNEVDPVTLQNDKTDEELVNSYEREGLSAAEVSSFDSNRGPDRDVWGLNEAEPITLEDEKADEELENSYEKRGLSDSVEDIEPNHKHKRCKCRRHCHRCPCGKAPTLAPAQAPSVASFDEFEEEGYELEGGKRKFCKCKCEHKPKPKRKPHPIPPTQPPAKAPAVF